MKPTAPSYIERPADREFLECLSAGEFCFVLTSRQMGKSSLMARTAARLRDGGALAAIVDLSIIGEGSDQTRGVSASAWYYGIARAIAKDLKLKGDLRSWWQQYDGMPEMQRFTEFLADLVLAQTGDRRVILFVDEIDTTLRLPFTDDFFAGIRACHNARATQPAFERLTFALLGVASPTELIKDTKRTPFNIGRRIELNDLTLEHATSLADGLPLEKTAALVALARVFEWTGGQPYLTQKLCLELSRRLGGDREPHRLPELVDTLVEELFLSPDLGRNEVHFQYIRDRVLQDPRRKEVLQIYRRTLRGEEPPDIPQSLAQNALKLAGLVRRTPGGTLDVRNRVYTRLFDEAWVGKALAKDPTRRRSFAVGAATILIVALPFIFLWRVKTRSAQIVTQAQAQVEALLGARPDAVPEILKRLEPLRPAVEPLLRNAFAQAKQRSVNQLNAAMGLAALGDLQPLQKMTARDPDPTSRTAFIHSYVRSPSSPLPWLEVLNKIPDNTGTNTTIADFRSAVCAALSLMEWDRLPVADHEALRNTISRLYVDASDAGTHGATYCALTRWKQPCPRLASEAKPSPKRDWFINNQGMTMVLLPTSLKVGDANRPPFKANAAVGGLFIPKQSIYVSDREVTVDLFRKFVKESLLNPDTPDFEWPVGWVKEDSKVSPLPECPVQNVNWFEAAAFCNWLSRQEDREPAYRALTPDDWELNTSSNGYRLPTGEEWEFACRAFSNTAFAFGQKDEPLEDYAWYISDSKGRTWPSGMKLPNLLGLFDFPGSVWELCEDRLTIPEAQGAGLTRVIRGGSWQASQLDLISASQFYVGPRVQRNFIGFRCVLADFTTL